MADELPQTTANYQVWFDRGYAQEHLLAPWFSAAEECDHAVLSSTFP
jgi:hypothetical protein